MDPSARRSSLLAALALCLALTLLPSTAEAIVRYSFTSQPADPHGVFSGFIEFDELLQAPNATIAIADFSNWAFAWGGAFTYDPSSHAFDPALSTFVLGSGLEVAAATALCVSPASGCLPPPPLHPFFSLTSNSVEPSFAPGGENNASAAGAWRFAIVSEPGTLALFAFGVGLILLSQVGRRRRRKKPDAAPEPAPRKRVAL